MAGKKLYHRLDEIGFIGSQNKRTPAQVKSAIDRTIQYIKINKSANNITARKPIKRRLSKAK